MYQEIKAETYSRKKGNLLDSNRENIFRNKKTMLVREGRKCQKTLKKRKNKDLKQEYNTIRTKVLLQRLDENSLMTVILTRLRTMQQGREEAGRPALLLQSSQRAGVRMATMGVKRTRMIRDMRRERSAEHCRYIRRGRRESSLKRESTKGVI